MNSKSCALTVLIIGIVEGKISGMLLMFEIAFPFSFVSESNISKENVTRCL